MASSANGLVDKLAELLSSPGNPDRQLELLAAADFLEQSKYDFGRAAEALRQAAQVAVSPGCTVTNEGEYYAAEHFTHMHITVTHVSQESATLSCRLFVRDVEVAAFGDETIPLDATAQYMLRAHLHDQSATQSPPTVL